VYTPAVSGYTVTSVKLSGVDAACLGQQLKVSLTATGGTSLIEVTGPGAGGTAVTGLNTITVTGNILATAVVGTSVVIYN
jgi:FlaG/FlaF family flagellin (archaellin)